MLKQLTGLGSKARELKKLMEGKRSITNLMRDIVDEIDYLQREVLSAVQCIVEEQEKAKKAKKNLRRSARERHQQETQGSRNWDGVSGTSIKGDA